MRTRIEFILLAPFAGLGLPSVGLAQAPVVRFEVSGAETEVDGFFGHAVAVTDFAFVFGAPYDDAAGPDSGAAYIFEVVGSSLEQTARLVPEVGVFGARFGFSVAADADTVLVGSPYGDGLSVGAGAVHVFERTPAGWEPTALLVAGDGAFGDAFGSAVSLSGDTVLIGAPDRDESGPDSGAAYVFSRAGGAWFQQAKLTPTDGSAVDRFGHAVSVDGDLVVIGAPEDDLVGPDSGSAYVFARSGTGSAASWSQSAKLQPTAGLAFDAFGQSVSISGTRALVGAPKDDETETDSGSAYVFEMGPAGWVQMAKLLSGDGAASDELGHAVSLSGDRALVGAPYDDDQAYNAGSAYVFEHDGASWSQTSKLERDAGAASENFGWAVASFAEIVAIGIPNAELFPAFPNAGNGLIQAPCWYGPDDCNANGIKDWCDIQNGESNDCNGNSIPDECEQWQCAVDVVFLLDTSDSMCDESDTLCSEIGNLDCQLYDLVLFRVDSTFLGITDTPSCDGSDCADYVTTTVLAEYGAVVPGDPPCCGILDDCTGSGGFIISSPKENWGPATAIVAEHFDWTPGALRLIIPITDEAPWCGNPCDDPGGDAQMVQHAIEIADQNDVIVSPILGNGANACTVALAGVFADGTGGSVFQSADAENDLVDGIAAILAAICGPAEDHEPICPGDGSISPCPCGNDAAPGSGSGCANSTGLGALLSASGSTSVTADDLVLIASQLPDSQFGILFMGPGQTSPLPFGDGLLCITPTSGQQLQEGLWRFPVTSSGSAGTITLGPGVVGYSSSNFGASGQILSGHTWNFQGWFRDPQGPCGGGFSLSNGMQVTFGP